MWYLYFITFIAGGWVGYAIACLMAVAKEADKERDE